MVKWGLPGDTVEWCAQADTDLDIFEITSELKKSWLGNKYTFKWKISDYGIIVAPKETLYGAVYIFKCKSTDDPLQSNEMRRVPIEIYYAPESECYASSYDTQGVIEVDMDDFEQGDVYLEQESHFSALYAT